LSTYPWHQDKLEQTNKLKNSRGEPIRNGSDFKLRLKTKDIFSSPEIIAEEQITGEPPCEYKFLNVIAVEKERQLREARKKVDEAWKAKLVVDNAYFYTSLSVGRNSQLDKIKVNLRIELLSLIFSNRTSEKERLRNLV